MKPVSHISKPLKGKGEDKYDDHYSDRNIKGGKRVRISMGGSVSGSASLKFG